jgi:hypothetical protein
MSRAELAFVIGSWEVHANVGADRLAENQDHHHAPRLRGLSPPLPLTVLPNRRPPVVRFSRMPEGEAKKEQERLAKGFLPFSLVYLSVISDDPSSRHATGKNALERIVRQARTIAGRHKRSEGSLTARARKPGAMAFTHIT